MSAPKVELAGALTHYVDSAQSDATEPVLTEVLEAQVELFAAFQRAVRFVNPSVTEEQREALQDVAAFVNALAVGAGSEADWGRLACVHADLQGHTDARRLLVLQYVQEALASTDLESRAGNLWFALIEWVDPLFRKFSRQAIEDELANRGKRGAPALAARLSIAAGAFGDRGRLPAGVAKLYDQAARGMRKSARSLPSS